MIGVETRASSVMFQNNLDTVVHSGHHWGPMRPRKEGNRYRVVECNL